MKRWEILNTFKVTDTKFKVDDLITALLKNRGLTDKKEIKNIELGIAGFHNVENATAAIIVGIHLGIDDEKIKAALKSFRGVKRRFEYIFKNENQIFIDDYAHHPEELRVLIAGAKAMFPNRKCTLVFQPHLFSRTRDLVEGFAEVLGLVEQVILLPMSSVST